MKTTIQWNGSKWAGEAPCPLEKLLEVLAQEPLHPRYERCLDTRVDPNDYHFGMPPELEGFTRHFHGNFYHVSHGFSVFTNDEAVIAALSTACEKNIASDAYKDAQRACKEGRHV